MRIYFYPECNFNINKASLYDCENLKDWFGSRHLNPDDYEIVGKDGEYHDCDYDGEVCAVYPKIMGGKKKGKNILTAVVGLALVLATGGTTAALFAHYGGINMAHALGAGLLLSGGGALLMGKMKMPSMDLSSDSATKQSYQWNVGNLSTSRGVKGVTFGANVIPEGELLAYRTYGTSTLEKLTRSETYYVNEKYKTNIKKWNYKTGEYEYAYAARRVAKTRTVDDSYLASDDSSYLELLIGAGEGELDSITDIRINDISLSDLGMVENVDYAIRLGSNTQTALKQTNIDSQVGYQSIGQTVPVKLNGSVTPLLITTPSGCDSCCIAFQAPNWYLYDTSSGAKNKAYIKPKIGYRLNGSTGAYTYIKTGVSEIDSGLPVKSDSAFYFQVVIKFPSNGTYQISIENDSAELNNTKGLLSNAEYSGSALPDRAAINMSVDNIACYNNKEQTYPGTALIWLRIPASQTLNGSMPKVTWKQTRANIYAYNGSSYVTKPADNLAWAIYDIIAQVRKDGNTYHNEGEDVSNIDYDKFVAFASFCDSIGAKGNWFLNKLDTSWSNAMSVATSCRAFIGLRSGKVCPYWDAPTEMTQIFTVGNYEDMSGVITAKKDRAKAIEATFNNEEEKFASRTVRVEIDNDHLAEAVSMSFVGLSNPINVSKQAHYILRRNKYLVQSVKFTADIDSIVCELNDVIGVQCDLTEYGVGGRIFKVENNVISLDAPVTLESGKTYALLVRHTDGTLERNTPVEINGTFTQLTFNNSWSKPVLKGDVYSFGIANSEVRKYRVTGITRTNDLKAQIEAIEYNENVYNELAVAPYTYTNPNAGINNVTTTYTPEAVELAWDANNNTSYVNVYVDGVFYGRYRNGTQIPNINSEQLVEMFPVNEYGEEDTPVVRTISNNLPTPSIPPVPVVQSTTTGCVAEFDGIPKDENIVWLIIKEGDNELGRVNILGEYMSVSIQLKSGTHTLSAYFVNQFSKSSQARTFTATPLGDIQANDISATALKLPTGSILRLSAKNCTTASIAEANGVKDVSGRGNHGRAFGGVTVVKDAEVGDCYSFDGTNDYISVDAMKTRLNGAKGATLLTKIYLESVSVQQGIVVGGINTGSAAGLALIFHSTLKLRSAYRINTGDSASYIDSETNFETGKWYDIAASVDFEHGINSLYINGVLDAQSTTGATGTLSYDFYSFTIGRQGNSHPFSGKIFGVRVYPRALSESEIKTIYMFPDDVTFGQLTADLIGANVIKAKNLIQSEAVISQTAQIAQAVVDNLNVSGNATFTNGLTSTLNSAKADATAKVKVVTDNIYTSGTTTINGGKITTGTIQAAAIAANAITAEKLAVIGLPLNPIILLNLQGLTSYAANTPIPDLSGNDNSFKIKGSWTSVHTSNTSGWALRGTNSNGKYILNTKAISMPASGWTFFMKFFAHSSGSGEKILFDCRPSGGGNTNRLQIRFDYGNNRFRILSYNSSGTQESKYVSQTINHTNWYDVVIQATSTTSISIYLTTIGDATDLDKATKKVTVTLNNARSDLTVAVGYFSIGGVSGNSANAIYGYIGDIIYYSRALSLDQIGYLVKNAANTEAGTITADRIAAGCVETRHLTADAIVGKTFQTASNTGTSNAAGVRFNSSGIQGFNGSAKTFDLSTNGKLTCSDVDLTGKITATSGSFGNWSLSNDYFVCNNTNKDDASLQINHQDSNYNYSKLTSTKLEIKLTASSDCVKATYSYSMLHIISYQDTSESKMRNASYIYAGNCLFERYNTSGSLTNSVAINPIYTSSSTPSSNTIYIRNGAGYASAGWASGCDESIKREIKDVTTLEKLKTIRVKKYKYSQKALLEKAWQKEQALKVEENLKKGIKTEEEKMPEFKDDENAPDYIMAMAGEFNKTFGVDNGNEEEINYTNAIGVALRAIQELAEISDAQKAEIAELKALLKNQGLLPDSGKPLPDYNEKTDAEPVSDSGKPLPDEVQQDTKSEAEPIEPTNEKNSEVEIVDVEPSFEELLKDGKNQEEGKK